MYYFTLYYRSLTSQVASPIYTKCDHEHVSAEEDEATKWLQSESPAHMALSKVLKDKQLLDAIKKLNQFCHTGKLENFNGFLTTLRAGLNMGVVAYNDGQHGLLSVMNKLGLSSGKHSKRAYNKMDRVRVLQSLKHSEELEKKSTRAADNREKTRQI